jgi:hypothetical protein
VGVPAKIKERHLKQHREKVNAVHALAGLTGSPVFIE